MRAQVTNDWNREFRLTFFFSFFRSTSSRKGAVSLLLTSSLFSHPPHPLSHGHSIRRRFFFFFFALKPLAFVSNAKTALECGFRLTASIITTSLTLRLLSKDEENDAGARRSSRELQFQSIAPSETLLTQKNSRPSLFLSFSLLTTTAHKQAMEQRCSALSAQQSKLASENAALASENEKLKEVKREEEREEFLVSPSS